MCGSGSVFWGSVCVCVGESMLVYCCVWECVNGGSPWPHIYIGNVSKLRASCAYTEM